MDSPSPRATTAEMWPVMTNLCSGSHSAARRLFLRCGVMVGLLRWSGGVSATSVTLGSGDSASVIRRLRFEIRVQNTGAETLPAQSLWTYAPVRQTSYQALVHVSSSLGLDQQFDGLGHTVLHWRLPPLPPHGTRVVGWEVTVRLWKAPRTEAIEAKGWLSAERHIESEDADVRRLAARLTRGASMDTVRAIYDWVSREIHYEGYIADDWGALRALNERRGDCTEYAYLVVALCRAAGIPARAIGGFVAPQDAAPRSSEYHNWAEVFVDGSWRLVDAQRQVFLHDADQYVAFRHITDRVLSPMGLTHRFVSDGSAVVHFR